MREVRVPGFAHLHTVSGFSLRYGASHPERLAGRASERGMDVLALTDRDTVAGAVRFAKACAGVGVRPVFGVDLAVGDGLSDEAALDLTLGPVSLDHYRQHKKPDGEHQLRHRRDERGALRRRRHGQAHRALAGRQQLRPSRRGALW